MARLHDIVSGGLKQGLVTIGVLAVVGLGATVTAQETADSDSQAATSEADDGPSTASNATESSNSESEEAPGPATSGEGIDIEISGGRRVLTTMAVPSTTGAADASSAADTVHQTLQRDFKLSGFFEILSDDAFFFDPSEGGMSAATIDFQNWFNVNAQALVKSEVTATEGDKVRLDLRLFDVDSGQRVTLDWSSKTVARSAIDEEVHAFTNAVVKHFTGTAGVAGTEITFVQRNKQGQKQIFISEIDGTDRQAVTDNNAINLLPSWGPNRTVYYTSYQHQNPDLWRWRGGTHKKLSSRSGQNSGAKYCDGKLALTLSMGENTDIYTIDAESGDKLNRLTDHWSIDTSPTWSPDCSKIAFVSGRSGGPQIYVMNADGSEQRRLTYQGSYNTSPDWSPVENKIAFTARDKYNRFDIFLVNLDGDLTRLTQDQGNNEQPSFSPDGRYIVFSSDRGGQGSRLWMMTSDGEIQHPVTPDGSKLSAPSWRPNF